LSTRDSDSVGTVEDLHASAVTVTGLADFGPDDTAGTAATCS
jgi:hypothetical protein